MNRSYTMGTEGINRWAIFDKNEVFYQIPFTEDTDVMQELIDSALLYHAEQNFFKECRCRDDIYVNETIVGQDYKVGSSEGAVILQELLTAFPAYENSVSLDHGLIGRYDDNTSINSYEYATGTLPSNSIQTDFSTNYTASNFKYYALNFNLLSEDILLKVVLDEYSGSKPDLPTGYKHYTTTHSQNGTSSDWIDVSVSATPKRIKEFCTDKSLQYPLPTDTHTDCDVVWQWNFAFNKNTLAYGVVKAYARYNPTD